jgi:hypothetical protein
MRKVQTISVVLALLLSLAASAQDKQTSQGQKDAKSQIDHQHDFDWEIGDWKVHLRRLLHPLTGSKSWVELEGTAHVQRVWNGKANLLELELNGLAGHIEGLSLRLYNPQSVERLLCDQRRWESGDTDGRAVP